MLLVARGRDATLVQVYAEPQCAIDVAVLSKQLSTRVDHHNTLEHQASDSSVRRLPGIPLPYRSKQSDERICVNSLDVHQFRDSAWELTC